MADTGMIDAETTAHVASVAGAARTASRQLALLPRRPRTPRCAPWPTPSRRPRRHRRGQRARTSSAAARRAWPRACSTGCASTPGGSPPSPTALRDIAAPARPGRGGGARLDAGQRPADPPGPGADGRGRHDLRGPAQRHGRRRRARPQERQRRGPARRVGRRRQQPRPGRRPARHAGGARPAGRRGHAARRGRSRRRPRADDAPAAWSTCSSRAAAPTSSSTVVERVHRAGDRDRRRATATSTSTPRPTSSMALRDRGQLQDPPGRACATRPSRCSCTASVADDVPAQGPHRARRGRRHRRTATPSSGRCAEAAGAACTVADRRRLRRRVPRRSTSACASWTASTQALEHIRRFGTGHTEAIVTEDRAAARRFTAEVDAAAVMVNASHPRSPTAASSASAPRSASRPRSCTPAARWRCPS